MDDSDAFAAPAAYDPYQLPDLNYWCQMPFWTSFELTCLSCGFDPHRLGALTFEDRQQEAALWNFLFTRRFFIDRHIEASHLDEHIGPIEGIVFLDQRGHEVIPALLSYCHLHSDKRTNWAAMCRIQSRALSEAHTELRKLTAQLASNSVSKPQSVSALQNKLKTVQRILTGVAKHQYGYNPKAARSTAPGQIVEDCAEENITVSPDTVRSHLREGAEQLED